MVDSAPFKRGDVVEYCAQAREHDNLNGNLGIVLSTSVASSGESVYSICWVTPMASSSKLKDVETGWRDTVLRKIGEVSPDVIS